MLAEISKSKASRMARMGSRGPYFHSRCIFAMLLTSAASAFASNPVPPAPARQARVKDISSVEGIRDNQLVGYGIVVGLGGTGDSQQTTFPEQTLAAPLLRVGLIFRVM